ncbi:MAG: hypothetical protein ACPGVG_16635 [Mycobacterium sp.]
MGGVLVVVVALTVGLVVWKSTSNQGPGGSAQSEAGLDRTVGLLREKDPVCDEWFSAVAELATREKKWLTLDRDIPATKWTPEYRDIFLSVGEAMTTAADKFESILPKARSVVLQELIAQTIMYLRAYVERIPEYVESDKLIGGAAGNFSNAVTYMCDVGPLLPASASAGKATRSSVPDPAALTPLMAGGKDPACVKFLEALDRQKTYLRGWGTLDSAIPAEQWTPDQRVLNSMARKVILREAKDMRAIAEVAESAIMADLLVTRAAYMQAYADAIPTYTPNDKRLWLTLTAIGGGLSAACKATL